MPGPRWERRGRAARPTTPTRAPRGPARRAAALPPRPTAVRPATPPIRRCPRGWSPGSRSRASRLPAPPSLSFLDERRVSRGEHLRSPAARRRRGGAPENEKRPSSRSRTGDPQPLPQHRVLPDQSRLRSEEHTSELQSRENLVCRLLLDPAPTTTYPLSLHDALPICSTQSLLP